MTNVSDDSRSMDDDEPSGVPRESGFLFAVFGQGLFSLTRLFTTMVIGGRFYQELQGTGSESELGIYLAYFSVLLLGIGLLGAFVTVPMTYLMHTREGERRKQFSSFLLVLCIWQALVAVAVCLVVGLGLQFWQPEISLLAIATFSFLIATQFVREFAIRWMLARLDSKRYAIFEATYFFIFVALLAGALLAKQVYIPVIFSVVAVVNLIVITLWWRFFRDEFVRPLPFLLFSGARTGEPEDSQTAARTEFAATLKEQVYFGRWIAADSVCALATMYFFNWLLLVKVNATAAGVYGACVTVVLLANPLINGLMSAFAPLAAVQFQDGGKPALNRTVMKYGLPIVCCMILFSIFLFFAGDWLTVKAFGDRYADFFNKHYNGVNRITFLIGLSIPLTATAYVLACSLMACGVPRYNFFSSLVGLAVPVLFSLLFRSPNPEHCAICFSVSILMMVVVRSLIYWKHEPAAIHSREKQPANRIHHQRRPGQPGGD